jgi:hypothetical protein
VARYRRMSASSSFTDGSLYALFGVPVDAQFFH